MGDIFSRIKKFIDFLEISNNEFGRTIGCSSAQITQMLTHKKNFGIDKLLNIISNYPNLNPNWLLTGEGSMLSDNNYKLENNSKTEEKTVLSKNDDLLHKMYSDLHNELGQKNNELQELKNELKDLREENKKLVKEIRALEKNSAITNSPTTNSDSHAETVQKKRSSSRISGSSAQPDAPTIK